MKNEDTNKTQEGAAKEEKAGGPQGCSEMFRLMMADGMPDCCKTQTKDMMAQWMSRFQASPGK